MSDIQVPVVLVVDDNPATRYSTSRILKSAGFDIHEAATGFEAISKANAGPDIIVLDVNLPDIDGFEVCRELRSNPTTSRTPVIHLSATFVTDDYKVQGLESGADGYLTHPVEPPVLIATVNAFLRARLAEERMSSSEAKFRAIFEQVQDGICLFTQELTFLEANPAMCGMLKRFRAELMEKDLKLFLPDLSVELLVQISHVLKNEGTWQGGFPLLDSDGQRIELDWRFSVHSVPGIWLAIVTDAAERLRVESEREQLLSSERAARSNAERANRLKDDFLATLSHELRTPLSAIVGWAQILKLGKALQQVDISEGIAAIERNANIQTQLINDLLDVSRITSGKLRLDIQQIDIASVASDALESLAPAILAKKIEVVRTFDPHSGLVAADPSRLQQMIWNLVSNAVKFSEDGGTIVVRVQRMGTSVELAVRDHGQGISADFLPHIFERFRQEDASNTRTHGGLGLGLAIVKHLVELHGGTVHADSQGENLGAEFTIRLPVAHAHQIKSSPFENRTVHRERGSTNYRSAGNIAGTRILVVDDDDDTRTLLNRLLRDCGAQVTTAASAKEALDHVAAAQHQILVSDIGMPNQNGYYLIRELRNRGYDSQNLPAIALTALAHGEDQKNALSAGFQLHLQKPVDPGELITAIVSLL